MAPAGRQAALTAALVATAALAAWGWLRPRPAENNLPPSRLSVPMPTVGGSATALQSQLALSPDGSTLLFAASAPDGQNRTMRMALHDTAATLISGVLPSLGDYVFAPDGREFIASVGLSAMYRFPVTGGSGRALPAGIAVGLGTIWSPTGTIWISAASDRERGIARLEPDGTVTYPYGAASISYYLTQLLPDGRTALATYQPLSSGAGPVVLFDLETGKITELISRIVLQARYTAGYLVLALADGTLEAVPFDPARKRILGEPVQIATGVSTPGNTLAQFAVSTNGTVAYIPEEARTLLLVDRTGRSRPVTAERRNFHAPMFSPNGQRIATDFSSTDGRDVWTLDITEGRLSRATFDRDGHDATWTPDGERLTYLSSRTGPQGVHRARPGRAESAELLHVSEAVSWSGHWLADQSGMVTIGNGLRPESRGDIAFIGNGGRGEVEVLVASRFEEQHPSVSGDGRWLAFTSDLSGRDEVYVRPLRGEGDQLPVSMEGGSEPVWNPTSLELFYRSGTGASTELVAATIAAAPRLAVTGRRPLFSVASMGTATPHANYDVSPDGQTFVMVGFNPASRIVVIQNLPALVARLQGGRQ